MANEERSAEEREGSRDGRREEGRERGGGTKKKVSSTTRGTNTARIYRDQGRHSKALGAYEREAVKGGEAVCGGGKGECIGGGGESVEVRWSHERKEKC